MICLRDGLLAVFIFGVSVVNLSPTEVNAQSLQVLTPDPELNAAIDAGSAALPFRADADTGEVVPAPAFPSPPARLLVSAAQLAGPRRPSFLTHACLRCPRP